MKIEKTRHGLPALWEEGGGYTNTGHAIIVAGPQGEPLHPIYVRRRGSLACGAHALFIVRPGYHVIQAKHHRGDFTIRIQRIVKIEGEEAETETLALYDYGEWDRSPPEFLGEAIEAAQDKATCYHCRSPHYYRGDQEGPR